VDLAECEERVHDLLIDAMARLGLVTLEFSLVNGSLASRLTPYGSSTWPSVGIRALGLEESPE
jgi:hypothetical protein